MLKTKDKDLETELREAAEQGKDISEYVWPYEWDARYRPAKKRCGNILSLPDAIDLCGSNFYGSKWTGKEWYAREPKDIDSWNPLDHLSSAYLNLTDPLLKREKMVDFTHNPKAEKKAYYRKSTIYDKLAGWLQNGDVKAFALHEGDLWTRPFQKDIPTFVWLLDDFLQEIFDSGLLPEDVFTGKESMDDIGYIYLNKEQLERAMHAEKDMESSGQLTPATEKMPRSMREELKMEKAVKFYMQYQQDHRGHEPKIQDIVDKIMDTPEFNKETRKTVAKGITRKNIQAKIAKIKKSRENAQNRVEQSFL